MPSRHKYLNCVSFVSFQHLTVINLTCLYLVAMVLPANLFCKDVVVEIAIQARTRESSLCALGLGVTISILSYAITWEM